MISAVRTILQCIGEDPDREGLQRTPERYAQAIMWMTRGYEERLTGQYSTLPLSFRINGVAHNRRNQRCHFRGEP